MPSIMCWDTSAGEEAMMMRPKIVMMIMLKTEFKANLEKLQTAATLSKIFPTKLKIHFCPLSRQKAPTTQAESTRRTNLIFR